MGHSVRTAATVREALAEFSRARDAGTPFDLLISDLGLPDASGLDLMRDVRGLDPQVAAIAVSGYGMEDDIHQCRQAGFNHHLTKPTNLQHLSALIQQIAPEKA
jgi:CheY-like chemotaxis protein